MSIQYVSSNKSLISDQSSVEIINLGEHGFADSFFSAENQYLADQSAPLVCLLDEESGLVQLRDVTLASQRYQEVDYSYTSSNSNTAKLHWQEYLESVGRKKDLGYARILEIGSNDGYLLKLASVYSQNLLGVDASPKMAQIAIDEGIETLVGQFGESIELQNEILSFYESFDLIFANNVLNHSNNPRIFVEEVAKLLSDRGLFVFEVPYWLETVKSLHFDQIYHEHVTYWTVKSVKALLQLNSLYIRHVEKIDYHGGSLRIFATKNPAEEFSRLDSIISEEEREGLFEVSRYIKYVKDINTKRDEIISEIHALKKHGKIIFGIGAAAKANTLLTYYGFNPEIMDFILDSSPHKQNKITPVTRIPIFDDTRVANLDNGIGIVLAWNLSSQIQEKFKVINSRLEFIEL